MTPLRPRYRSRLATALFDWLNPVPYGLFVGTLIFDIIYANTAVVLWAKAASWLVTVGLLFAIVPRFINLGHVWFGPRGTVTGLERTDFWLNLLGIVAAIVNAFVHSRDGYAMIPLAVILSVVTVALLSIAQVALALDKYNRFSLPEAARE
jgi:uncharacterized membrane protein